MTREEFNKRISLIKNEEAKLSKKLISLRKEFIQELPFKVGDKVSVRNYGEGWIKFISVNDYCKISLKVCLPKKNGEPSKSYRCLWFLDVTDITKNE